MELREKIGRIISGYGKHYQIAEVTGNAIADLILDIPEIKEALETAQGLREMNVPLQGRPGTWVKHEWLTHTPQGCLTRRLGDAPNPEDVDR